MAGLLLRPSGDATFGHIESTCDRGMENRNGTCSKFLVGLKRGTGLRLGIGSES